MPRQYIFCLALLSGIISISAEPRSAIAHLVSGNIVGSVRFTETDDGLHVTGAIVGMPAGSYGFHIHELGDVTTCDTTGGHFNPGGMTHGGQHHEVRHVGDLGNLVFVENESAPAVATINIMDGMIALRGDNNIVGRAVVLHELEDDYGQGDNDASLITGNAGPRVACAVIGVLSPNGPWNAAHVLSPSAGFIALLLALVYYRKNAV